MTEENDLKCLHEEADTRIIFHLYRSGNERNVLIRASDTDILIILLGNMHQLSAKQIWITAGNKSAAFNCTELFKNLGLDVCKALPFLHAYTGCDFNPSFKGKGKVKPLTILTSSNEYQSTFAQLLHPDDIYDIKKMKSVQKFTNEMYGIKSDDVNRARVTLFNKKYASQKIEGAFF